MIKVGTSTYFVQPEHADILSRQDWQKPDWRPLNCKGVTFATACLNLIEGRDVLDNSVPAKLCWEGGAMSFIYRWYNLNHGAAERQVNKGGMGTHLFTVYRREGDDITQRLIGSTTTYEGKKTSHQVRVILDKDKKAREGGEPHTTRPWVLVENNDDDDEKKVTLKEAGMEYLQSYIKLMLLSDGRFDILDSAQPLFKKISMDFLCSNLPIELTPATDREQQWLHHAYGGGLRFLKHYTGPALDYDFRSFYPSLLKKESYPAGASHFIKRRSFLDLDRHAIYKCELSEETALFRARESDEEGVGYYTNIDVREALEAGLDIKLYSDDENTLYWDETIAGDDIFGEMVDILYAAKQSGECSHAKFIINSMSGLLGARRWIDMNDLEGNAVRKRVNRYDKSSVQVVPETEIFDYPQWCRFPVFMTAYGRAILRELISDIADTILVYAHTDGFTVTEDIEVPTGDDLGELTLKHQGIVTTGKVCVWS